MGLDKLNLTIYESIDSQLLEEIGSVYVSGRDKLYRYFCDLGHCQIMWHPHKFGPEGNSRIAYTKIDFSPKHFPSFNALLSALQNYFPHNHDIGLNRFHISRIDVKADIENLPLDVVQARLFIKGLRRDSLNIFKSSIYMGSNPKVRIYSKTKELKARLKQDRELTEWEQTIVDSEKELTRFEIMIKRPGLSLNELAQSPASLVSYFDRLEFYDFEDDQNISSAGGLQMLLRNTRREFRKPLEQFKADTMKQMIRQTFLNGINQWFDSGEQAPDEDIPF
ncbi:MAG: hypothetical protein G3M78_08215 [Candidatus Nitrohelix vancouverensis]|uniref:Uncharacterized protein n=1 Tax=Candidatus Nitrohelix vancouverensis TaxID=2705534 RepID=A0A7T0G3G0_9BACT|nr:MAG: hypothetical protein G3M78_08215 [Candidatus Nitrohelix vancouverensis]